MINVLREDIDFQELIKKYEEPNCYGVLNKKLKEEQHSGFVKWLLDPEENHKLGYFSLEKLIDLIKCKDRNLQIDKNDIKEMKFRTEHNIQGGRLDIFGESSSLIIVIENKIDAKETINDNRVQPVQTDHYYNFFEDRYADRKKLYIHLNAYSSKVENSNFIPVTYQELYDYVIKQTCEKCDDLGFYNIKNILEQYAIYISRPNSEGRVPMIYINKEKAEKIYNMHRDTIALIRQKVKDSSGDKDPEIFLFYEEYGVYLNELVLAPLGKNKITYRTDGKIGEDDIRDLVERGYIIPNKSKLVYTRNNHTINIMINENGMYYAGYYNDINSIKEVIEDEEIKLFKNFHAAAVAVENEIAMIVNPGKILTNPGINPKEARIYNAGNEKAEEKKIKEIINKGVLI